MTESQPYLDERWRIRPPKPSKLEVVGHCAGCGAEEWLVVRTYAAHTSRAVEAEHQPDCPGEAPLDPPSG